MQDDPGYIPPPEPPSAPPLPPLTAGQIALRAAQDARAKHLGESLPERGTGTLTTPQWETVLGPLPEFDTSGIDDVTVPAVKPYVPGKFPDAYKPKSEVDFDKARARRLAALRGEADPYAEQEKRLAAREADITGDAETNKWLALAKAGFEAAGGTSQYALTNIGKGGVAGLADYVAGEKEISARQDRAFDARTALTSAKIQLDTARKSEADKYAQGLISKEERDNNVRKAEADYQMNVYKVQEATRRAEFEARSLTESRQWDADLLAQERKYQQATKELDYKIRMRQQLRDDLRIKYQNNMSAYTDQEKRLDREWKKDIELFNNTRRDLADDMKLAFEQRKLEITEEGKTARTILTEEGATTRTLMTVSTESAAVKTARAAMDDPALKSTLIDLGVGPKLKKAANTAALNAWKAVLKPYISSEVLPTEKEWLTVREMFIAQLAGTHGIGDDAAAAYADSFIRRATGRVGAATNLADKWEIGPDGVRRLKK